MLLGTSGLILAFFRSYRDEVDVTSQNIGNEKYGERYVILYSIHVKTRKKSFDFSIS